VIGAWLRSRRRRKEASRLGELAEDRRHEAERLIAGLRSDHLTYVGTTKLQNLAWAALAVGDAGIPGDFVEAGVALGGSAILLGKLKPPGTPLLLYDVFATIPPPGANDGEDAHHRYSEIAAGKAKGLGEDRYYGYVDDLIAVVCRNLESFGLAESRDEIELIKGMLEVTLRPQRPVALAHIDCDWYDSVKVCTERLYPVLSPGAIMVFDDYRSYSGCREAVDEFLSVHSDMRIVFHAKSIGVRKDPESSSK
jgi:hypothetical protein